MAPKSDLEHMAAHGAMQLAHGVPKVATVWYKRLLPGAKLPAKPSVYFPYWFKRLGGAVGVAVRSLRRLGRKKKIPDHVMLGIAKGPLQQPYYSHGVPVYPLSVAEVRGKSRARPLRAPAALHCQSAPAAPSHVCIPAFPPLLWTLLSLAVLAGAAGWCCRLLRRCPLCATSARSTR